MASEFSSVLIANRGEIACRIMRTAARLGLKTIAVYSEADASAPHVKMADQAFCLGPAPVGESYLNQARLIEAIKTTGAQSVHPGYGFLSENADFARACADAGVTFIGPPADAIELMGDKAAAKRRMIDAGVPCVPGYQDKDQSPETLKKQAEAIGYPVMLKATAGGGGRGMRLVRTSDEMDSAISAARSEAENAFGAGDLIIEKAILRPRHVEIQVFADDHGNVTHFGERDCSVQRRHQKVLEEAPCPVMTPALRDAMGTAAVKAARDINYVGAGTVEFLLDENGEFYFLEMNTRLQVEHPVTEEVTGHDLVELQIRIAHGEKLGLAQDEISVSGHAIEARLYAEDTANDFLPASGTISCWRPPVNGARVDAGIESGSEISSFYDPMIAKIIGRGPSRDAARRNLINALRETACLGLTTNRSFLIEALEHPVFADSAATTAFIADEFPADRLAAAAPTIAEAALAAVLHLDAAAAFFRQQSIHVPAALMNWASATRLPIPVRYRAGDTEFALSVSTVSADTYEVTIADTRRTVSVLWRRQNHARLRLDGETFDVAFHLPTGPTGPGIDISTDRWSGLLLNLNAVAQRAEDADGGGTVVAPMHGTLQELFVATGDTVAPGDTLCILEAMKMQHEITASVAGTVSEIPAATGTQVDAGSVLIEIDVETEA